MNVKNGLKLLTISKDHQIMTGSLLGSRLTAFPGKKKIISFFIILYYIQQLFHSRLLDVRKND